MYPYEIIMVFLQPILEVGLLALFWSMVAQSSENPINVTRLIVYFVIVQFISSWSINPTGLQFAGYVSGMIKNGYFTQYLIRPISPLFSVFSNYRGFYVLDMIISLIFLIFSIIIIGDVSLVRFLFFIVFLIFSFIISFSFCTLIASLAFRIKEISGIRHSVAHMIKLLSGAMVPLTFFPDVLQNILRFSPFPSMMFAPINILQYESALSTVRFDFFVSLFWSIILLTVALYSWRKGLKTYEAVGI